MAMWGIHNDYFDTELLDEGFVSIGYDAVPDLRTIGPDRERIKDVLRSVNPDAKPGAIPVWAGVLMRFAFEMEVGDVVVAPRKADSTLSFGVITGKYDYISDGQRHPHRRAVEWRQTGVARGGFPQDVLYEVGSAVTLFQIRKGVQVFTEYMATDVVGSDVDSAPHPTSATDAVTIAEDEPNADRIDQHTRDFVANTLLRVSPTEFEEFTADLLRAMGYEARVTPSTGDGGVDVIAHKDPLGLEPPIIKVQCKRTSASHGRPDIQGLIGTLATGELGLFVTLGTYSRGAVDLERERQNLRLLSGADVTSLTIKHYDRLAPRWRNLLPLRRVLVVDRDPEEG